MNSLFDVSNLVCWLPFIKPLRAATPNKRCELANTIDSTWGLSNNVGGLTLKFSHTESG